MQRFRGREKETGRIFAQPLLRPDPTIKFPVATFAGQRIGRAVACRDRQLSAARRFRAHEKGKQIFARTSRGLQRLRSSIFPSLGNGAILQRSEEHTSETQSLMRNTYADFCLKKKKKQNRT